MGDREKECDDLRAKHQDLTQKINLLEQELQFKESDY